MGDSIMVARTSRMRVIRERNERSFCHFLQNLKTVFRLFLTPDNVQLTTDALIEARHHLFDAKGTLFLLMNDLVRGDPNPTGLPTNVIQAPLQNFGEYVTQLIYVLSVEIEKREEAEVFDLETAYSTSVT